MQETRRRAIDAGGNVLLTFPLHTPASVVAARCRELAARHGPIQLQQYRVKRLSTGDVGLGWRTYVTYERKGRDDG